MSVTTASGYLCQSLASELRSRGVEAVISPIQETDKQIIEIRLPSGTVWLVLVQARDCKGFK